MDYAALNLKLEEEQKRPKVPVADVKISSTAVPPAEPLGATAPPS